MDYQNAPRPQAGTNLSSLRAKTAQPAKTAPAPAVQTVSIGLDTMQGFEALQRMSNLFVASQLVPEQFRNTADACIALNMAMRLKADPLMVMQSLYVVHGKPAWSAQFLIATFNKSGKYTSLHYRMQGKPMTDEYGCQAYATELASGDEVTGPWVTLGIAKREGWLKNPKWSTMPDLMLRYRAAAWMIRTVAPEIAMGIETKEEVQDVYETQRMANGSYAVTLDDMRRAKEEAREPEKTPEEPPFEPDSAPDEVPQPKPEAPQEAPKETPKRVAAPVKPAMNYDDAFDDECARRNLDHLWALDFLRDLVDIREVKDIAEAKKYFVENSDEAVARYNAWVMKSQQKAAETETKF